MRLQFSKNQRILRSSKMKMSKKTVAALAAVVVFGGMTVGAPMQAQAHALIHIDLGHHDHPELDRALGNLESAQIDLQSRSHHADSHLDKARDLTSHAIDQVQQAFSSVHRSANAHARLEDALTKLQSARDDLSNAKHEFDGHRQKALDLTNHAIDEVNQALNHHH